METCREIPEKFNTEVRSIESLKWHEKHDNYQSADDYTEVSHILQLVKSKTYNTSVYTKSEKFYYIHEKEGNWSKKN